MTRLPIIATIACLVALLTIGRLRRAAVGLGLVDRPGGDPLKIHADSTPFVGGLGMAMTLPACLALGSWLQPALAAPLGLATLIGLGLAALGLYDDLRSARPGTRLLLEGLAGATFGAFAQRLGIFGAHVVPVASSWGSVLTTVVSAVVVVGVLNAVNMQDGLDGHAGTLGLVSALGYLLVGLARGDLLLAILAANLAGALLGFLRYNAWPASVFMGDNGSYLIGFLIGAMALLVAFPTGGACAGRTVAAALLLVGVPLLDVGFAVVRRLSRGVSPLRGDRSHYYDLLRQSGLSVPRIVAVGALAQAVSVAAGLAVLFARTGGR